MTSAALAGERLDLLAVLASLLTGCGAQERASWTVPAAEVWSPGGLERLRAVVPR